MKPSFLQRYLAEKINLQKAAGSLQRISSVLASSTIELNPYQIYAALYAFNSPLARGAILADEVGLGKTIEAGIVISQLYSEGKRKILIITPASIRKQWQDELLIHFGLETELIDSTIFEEKVSSGEQIPFKYDGVFICSLQFAYKMRKLISKQKWHLVVIDEAHRLRNVYKGRDASKMGFELREVIQENPKLLLTATPLQNNLMELYGLVSFIDDKILGSKYGFKTRYVDPINSDLRRYKDKLLELRQLLHGKEDFNEFEVTGILTRTLRKQVTPYIRFRSRHAFTQDFTPTELEQQLYDKVSAYLQRPKLAAIQATQRNLMILVYRKLLASSSFAIAGTLKKLYQGLEKELADREKTRRKKKEPLILFKDLEEGFSEELEELTIEEELENQIKKTKTCREEFSDEDIKKEISELKEYCKLAISIKENAKGKALIQALRKIFHMAREKNWPQKVVIFTESTRTQQYLANLFKENGFSFTLFRGQNSSPESRKIYREWVKKFPESAEQGNFATNVRQALIWDFKTKKQILLSTEAGGEGLNLQFCNIVVNYDLPWNPQRLEQRIGRCHRYGQKYEVLVANFLNTKNRADQRVLELLQSKFSLFDGLFGASDEILGLLESGISFQKRILEIYQNCKTPEEIDKAFDELQDSLEIRAKLTDTIQNARRQIMDNFDEPVAKLFKQTKLETDNILSEFDENLLRFSQLYFRDKLKSIKEPLIFRLKLDRKIRLVIFRELKEEEKGKYVRIHKDLPFIKTAIEKSKDIQTKPIPETIFQYTKSEKHFTQIEPYLNKDGLIYLFKLKIEGVENEELLAPMAFIKENNNYQPISLEIAEQILSLSAEETKNEIEKSPLNKNLLFETWENWKEQVLKKYRIRNERLYDREVDRIERFYEDYALQVEDKIQKLDNEKEGLEKRKTNSSDFEERRVLHKKIQENELKIDKLRIEQIKLKEEAYTRKKKDFKILEEKLSLGTKEELIAITKFRII